LLPLQNTSLRNAGD